MTVIPFVLSAAMLAYEILLTRIASVLLINPYTFMVLGMALLGIAAGAILEYGVARRSTISPVMNPGLWLGSSASVLMLTLVWLVKGNNIGGVFGLGLAAALPFMVSGAILARLFRLYPERTGNLYAADLAGAAAGALLVPILLPAVGPIQSIGFLAAVLGLTGIVTAWRYQGRRSALFSTLVTSGVMIMLVANHLGIGLGALPVGKNPNKDLARLLSVRQGAAEIVESPLEHVWPYGFGAGSR